MRQSVVWLLNEKYKGKLTEKAKKDIERLKKGEPVDYVIGYRNFLGCKIDLRYKPLIPRDETKFWVKQAIKKLQTPRLCKTTDPRALRILDMFSGSGCIGIAILKHLKNTKVDFMDIDDSCLKQIRLNLKINRIDKKRYRVIKSDVFFVFPSTNYKLPARNASHSDAGGPTTNYNVIFANPPYIAKKDIQKVQKSSLFFEPKEALFSYNNGLGHIKKFLKQAKKHLAENGAVYMEFGEGQKKEIEKILEEYGYKDYRFFKDQFGKERYLQAKS